jgi:hypothetical protein
MPLGQWAQSIRDEVDDIAFEAADGMAGEVEPQGRFFVIEAFLLRPWFDLCFACVGGFRRGHVQQAEKIVLSRGGHGAVLFGGFQRVGQLNHVVRAIGINAVQSPGSNQGFQYPPIGLAGVYAATKIAQIGEGSVLPTFLENFIDGAFAHALDGAEPILDGTVV